MFGFVEFFMFVSVSGRNKRVMLAKVPCCHHEAADKLFEFRKENENHLIPATVHAEFKFTDYLC
jgi:hypothetical protein